MSAKIVQATSFDFDSSSPKLKIVQDQKDPKVYPFLCNFCGDRFRHVGRQLTHHKRDHKDVAINISIPKEKVKLQRNRYECGCAYSTNHEANFKRHQRICNFAGNSIANNLKLSAQSEYLMNISR